MLLSAIISLGLAFRSPPLVVLERFGVDLSMRAYVAFAPWLDPAFREPSPTSYAFVDIDTAACEAFNDGPALDCRVRNPASPALIADFARALRQTGAKVAIIDVEPPADRAQRLRLETSLASDAGPWIIAPTPGRPNFSVSAVDLLLDSTAEAPVQLARGRLRLAPTATTSDVEAEDGIIRHFPMLAQVEDPLAGGVRWLPTAPYLAAALADPQKGPAIDCRFYGRCQAGGPAATPAQVRELALGQDRALRNRIIYTLPTLAVETGRRAEFLTARYLGQYDRYVASRLLVDGRFDIPPGLLDGRIVILGSSAPQAYDWHPTPIGAMAGPEIVLNASRAFAAFAPLEEIGAQASAWRKLQRAGSTFIAKTLSAAKGAVLMTFVWLGIFWLMARHAGRRRLVRVIGGLGFVAGLGLMILLEMVDAYSSLRASGQLGQATDVLTPLIALGLEGFAEISKACVNVMERWILAMAARVTPWLERLHVR